MFRLATVLILCLLISWTQASFLNYTSFTRIFDLHNFIGNETGNELWHGILKDCKKRVSFSCIQKNAYTYLDSAFIEKDNITVFDGLVLRKNQLRYQQCDRNSLEDNVIESGEDCGSNEERGFEEELTPLEEITSSLRQKTVKFLATRDYELQLPEFFFEGANLKISPREIDDNGALIRVDFGQKDLESQGRLFKKLRKFLQNKLLMSFFAAMLIIKLIKVKFMFVIPFLFGVGTAKKLFLKLLLFFVPAFAHVFKLCSSYYSSTKHHHHHHQIAHHHHHVPVPVPVPAVTPVHPPIHHAPYEEFDGYDYAHPGVQYRKDIEELKEWGIEPNDEPYEEPVGPVYPGPFNGYKAPGPSPLAHNLAYSAYSPDKVLRRGSDYSSPAIGVVSAMRPNPTLAVTPVPKVLANVVKPQVTITRIAGKKVAKQVFDDDYFGPIVQRLDEILLQMGIVEEGCKVSFVCKVYRDPLGYSPTSNHVSIELSRDSHDLPTRIPPTESSQRFHLFVSAARLGQDRGDCEKSYPCANKL